MQKVLVVDDEASVVTTLRVILEKEGYEVRTAEDGVRALEAFSECRPDVLVTDMVMPNSEGIELIASVREAYPETGIIGISGASHRETYLRTAKLLGASEILEKPVLRKELLDAVRRAADRQ